MTTHHRRDPARRAWDTRFAIWKDRYERSCDTFSLDSGAQRQQAHKFYFREGMTITSFHFDKKISKSPTGIKFS